MRRIFGRVVDMLNHPFDFLDSPKRRLVFIALTCLFAVFFINVYHPFNINRWYSDFGLPLFIVLSSYGLIGFIVLFFSQMVAREMLQFKMKRIGRFLLWSMGEIFLLALVFTMVFGNLRPDFRHLLKEFFVSLRYTALVVVIPYSISLILNNFSKNRQRFLELSKTAENGMARIHDESGELKISVEPSRLLFIRSADNYAEIYLLKQGAVKKELVRSSLKRLEGQLLHHGILRCHRSFMVNKNRIILSQKTSSGFQLGIEGYDHELIPVSDSYKDIIGKIINPL
jgi:hypothetical protein